MQLVAAILLLGTLAMVAFGAVGTARLRSTLQDGLDGRLQSAAGAPFGRRSDAGPFGGSGRPGLTENSTWEAVVDPAGRLLDSAGQPTTIAFPGFVVVKGTQTPPRLPTVTAALAVARPQPFTVDPAGPGTRWRVVLKPLTTNGATTSGTLIVALTQEAVDAPVAALTRIDLLLGGAVLLALGLSAWAVVAGSLRPLIGVEHTAAAIAAGDLSRRVPIGSDRTEIGRLGGALNVMLGHIEAAFTARSASEAAAHATAEQMRRFAADASHELRTPLTSIRGFAEMSRAGMVPPGPDTERVMQRIEAEAIRMTGLVEDLLLLARLDQQRPLDHQPVDLLQIAADTVHDAAAVAPTRPLTLHGPGPDTPATTVLGDEARLRQVLSNLLANALHHTPPGTPVQVRVTTTATTVTVQVSDQGPGLTADQARHVFDRFYRADTSRTRSSGGSGLGLSIVTALVQAHRGTITLHTAPGAGAAFTISLPLAPPTHLRWLTDTPATRPQ